MGTNSCENFSTYAARELSIDPPLRLRTVPLCLDTTTGPRFRGSGLPQSIGAGWTPTCLGYVTRTIFGGKIDKALAVEPFLAGESGASLTPFPVLLNGCPLRLGRLLSGVDGSTGAAWKR
jgi:hypothetical protein